MTVTHRNDITNKLELEAERDKTQAMQYNTIKIYPVNLPYKRKRQRLSLSRNFPSKYASLQPGV